jgi:hypothetical protein
MKKILIVLAAAFTIVSCKDASKTDETVSTTTIATDAAPVTTAPVAANVPAEPVVDPATLTKVEWVDGSTKNFGKITEGQTLNVTFKFKNTGDKPLVIANVSAQCGCTIPEQPKEPIAPGATGEIKAAFNSTGKPGTQNKEVYVVANTEPQKTTLTFSVEVKPKS